jgi:hemerythrin-like domain-containing protein
MSVRLVAALGTFGDVLRDTYFPTRPESAEAQRLSPGDAVPASHDPFEQLGREHAEVENVLRLLDEMSSRAECGLGVARNDLFAIVGFFTDFGVLAHHEKEEAILMPALLREGFSWQDGPLAAVRRDHRQEHYFLRVLTHLCRQHTEWSSEDRRQFASVAREFTQFLRAHMRFEQREVFEPASRRLSSEAKASLRLAFGRFEVAAGSVSAARQRLNAVLEKYGQRQTAALPFERAIQHPARVALPLG